VQEKKRKKTDPALQLAVGQRIKELREHRNWSQEEFADRAGVHRTYIGSAENGARNLTIQVLVMFARTFGIKVSELLAGVEERARSLAKPSRPKVGARRSEDRHGKQA
jgi:transcriptional regulator with XRE-family HTH domain